jgi:oxalate decarboxylase
MTYGACRVTVLDVEGRPYVGALKAGDLWYFPAGAPHSLQGLGPDGCEFVICFDDGHADEFNTLLLSDWFAHTPPEVLAKNFGVPAEAFAKIPLHNLWIFQGTVPGDLAADRAASVRGAGAPPHPFIFPLGSSQPIRETASGNVRVADSTNFNVARSVAAALVTVKPGGIREMHWHQQAEWSIMTYGHCRITVLDAMGRPYVQDVKEGDLWYFPAGLPHSLQGLGPDGAEFVLAFDNGLSSEYNTLLPTDWLAHTPPEVRAKSFGVPADAFKNIPLQNRWIFQGELPGPLAEDQAAVKSAAGEPPFPFTFSLADAKPASITAGGQVQIADSRTFKVSTTIAAALVTLKPGGIRELHWHPNADEWQYYLKGEGRATVFNTGPSARTADFRAGDVGYVKKSLGHYVENTGSTDLVFLEVFKADRFEEVSLSDWFAHTPPAMVAQTFNLDPSVIARFQKVRRDVMPA